MSLSAYRHRFPGLRCSLGKFSLALLALRDQTSSCSDYSCCWSGLRCWSSDDAILIYCSGLAWGTLLLLGTKLLVGGERFITLLYTWGGAYIMLGLAQRCTVSAAVRSIRSFDCVINNKQTITNQRKNNDTQPNREGGISIKRNMSIILSIAPRNSVLVLIAKIC